MKNVVRVESENGQGNNIRNSIYFALSILGLVYIVLVVFFGFEGNDGFAKVIGISMPAIFEQYWGQIMTYVPFGVISLFALVAFSGRLRKVAFLIILITVLAIFVLMKTGIIVPK